MCRRDLTLALIVLAVVMCLSTACGKDGDSARHRAIDPEDEATLKAIAFAPWVEPDSWVKGREAEGVRDSQRNMRQGALHYLALKALSEDQWRLLRKADPWVDRRVEAFEKVRDDTLARIRALQTGQARWSRETMKSMVSARIEMDAMNFVAEQALGALGDEWLALLKEIGLGSNAQSKDN